MDDDLMDDGTLEEGNGVTPPTPTGTEGQPAQNPPPVPDGSTPPADPAAAKPVEYGEFTIPDEATNVAVNEEVMGGFKALASELNLSQEQAQKVVAFGANAMHKAIGDGMEAIRAQVEEVKLKWRKEAIEDPAVKTDLPFAQRVVDRFRDDDFVGMLNETGVGSHKAMIKFLIQVGKAMGEAPLLTGGVGTTGIGTDVKSLANSIYEGKM